MQRQFPFLIFAFATLLSVAPLRLVLADDKEAAIIHSVFFKLKHQPGSAAELSFYAEASKLAQIPGVENFQWLKELSPKNGFDYGLSMRFANQAAYDRYNQHPDHVAFVENVWIPNVADFLEIDYLEGTSPKPRN